MVASHEKNMHKEATNANWIKVSVAGLGKALRMAFEEVFVRALDRYQIMQSIYTSIRMGNSQVRGRGRGVHEQSTWARPAPLTHPQLHAHWH